MFDLHVHSAPDVVPRRATDVETAAMYEAAGAAGCVLKCHVESTVGRAAAAGAGRAVSVHGGIVLNEQAGGLNPAAVAATLELGGRIVWMPTLDTCAHRAAGLPRPGGASYELDAESEALQRILALVAEADAVLATGHLSARETGELVALARRAGVRRILVTHASFTVPALSAAEARALDAVVEVTAYQLLHQAGMDAARLAAFVREVGIERCICSSDAGQLESPPAPEALRLLIDALAAEGLDAAALEAAASERPAALVYAEA